MSRYPAKPQGGGYRRPSHLLRLNPGGQAARPEAMLPSGAPRLTVTPMMPVALPYPPLLPYRITDIRDIYAILTQTSATEAGTGPTFLPPGNGPLFVTI